MPITFVTFGLGYLAIIGIPPFAGYFSKDKIIEAAFAAGGGSGVTLGIAALLGAGLTAFYMTRVMLMTFFGARRWAEDAHPHESPRVMTGPMILLALGSIGAGGLFVVRLLAATLARAGGRRRDRRMPRTPCPAPTVTLLALAVVLAGVARGLPAVRRDHRPVPAVAPAGVTALTVAARRDLYGDAFNEAVLRCGPAATSTRALIDLDSRGHRRARSTASPRWSPPSRPDCGYLQTGFVRSYALSMLTGAALVVVAVLLAGGGVAVTSFPWLTVSVAAVPLAGAVAGRRAPARSRARRKSRALVGGAGGARAGDRGGRRLPPARRAVPVRRIAQLDHRFRRALHRSAWTASRWRWCC